MKTVLLTGGKGMLGSTLTQHLKSKGYTVIQYDFLELDITNLKQIQSKLDKIAPDFLINCAAYTNVDLAEEEREKATIINSTAVGYLAKETYERKIKFIHISTDYVFSLNKQEGYIENEDNSSKPALNAYGETKRLGELEAISNNPDSYIVRVQWSFGPNGKNIIDTMLTLAETKTELNVVSDEYGVPTYTLYMAQNLEYIMANQSNLKSGYYHIVSEGVCSRLEQIQYIYEVAGINMKLNPIKLIDYKRKAKIPNYSILINTKLPKLPTWQEGISQYIKSKK